MNQRKTGHILVEIVFDQIAFLATNASVIRNL